MFFERNKQNLKTLSVLPGKLTEYAKGPTSKRTYEARGPMLESQHCQSFMAN